MSVRSVRFLRPLTATVCSAALVLGASTAAQAADTKLPDTMTWSSYDVGSAGYAEASAIADAFGKKYGTRIRIQPSGSSIGRLQPLLSGRADVGFLATETFFATEVSTISQLGSGGRRICVPSPAGRRPSVFLRLRMLV